MGKHMFVYPKKKLSYLQLGAYSLFRPGDTIFKYRVCVIMSTVVCINSFGNKPFNNDNNCLILEDLNLRLHKQGSRIFPLCYSAGQSHAMICGPNVLAKYCPLAFMII